jgi:hypothetical protein
MTIALEAPATALIGKTEEPKVCPACQFCADHGFPHVCITRGDQPDGLLNLAALEIASRPDQDAAVDFDATLELLELHPAEPLGWHPEDPDVPILHQVDQHWCGCGCTTARGDQ